MTVMFRKSDILKVGNYQEWFWNEDYYLWIRLVLAEKKFANLPDTLVKVRVGEDMYQRRGGMKYFESERNIQRMMLKEGMILMILFRTVAIGSCLAIKIILENFSHIIIDGMKKNY